MIIIILQLILIFYLLKKYITNDDLYYKVKKLFIWGLSFQVLLLFIYRFNLYWLGRNVYFSDAETYWSITKTLLSGGTVDAYNKTYFITCYFIQKLSPFIWVGWNNIFNILCVDLSIILITVIMYKNDKQKQISYFLYFTLFNPLIYYSLMRNLKDAMFIFMVFTLGYFLEKTTSSKKHVLLFSALTLLSMPIFYNIRPWAFIIPVLALLVLIIDNYEEWKKYKKYLFIAGITIFIIGMLLFGKMVIVTLQVWIPVVMTNFLSRSFSQTILGFGKFFIGPGFYRALFGAEFFEHYTITGNIMTAIGSLLWYFQLSLMICMLKKPIKNIKKSPTIVKYLILFLISFVGIYVMQYGGSVEIRMRGVLYLTTFSLFFTTFDYQMTKKNVFVAMLLFFCIFLVSVLLG